MADLGDVDEKEFKKPNIKGDRVNIIVLISMYILQNALSGLNTGAFPIMLQKRNVSYADQAEFSLSDYPFCLKLLWAPIVDCVYSKRFGRRKTWLIPMQYLTGAVCLWMSMNIDDLLGSEDGSQKPKMRLLLVLFSVTMFFITVQDIALDGWALTMLQRHNIGYSGLCQNIGGIVGSFVSYGLIIILDSKDFCNKFRSVPQDHGFFSLANYLFFWSAVWLVSATLILVFKKENSSEVTETDKYESRLGLIESYVHLWRIFRVRPIVIMSAIFITFRVGFAPLDIVGNLKMIEAGVTQENVVLSKVPEIPIEIALSVIFRRSLTGPRAMQFFIITYILRLIVGVLFTGALFLTSYMKDDNKTIFVWYNWVLLAIFNMAFVIRYLMLISVYSFACRVSDARYGGMYITLLMTMHNVGYSWPSYLVLSCVDLLTIKTCIEDETLKTVSCHTKLDGFYVESIIFTIFGFLWLCWGKKIIHELETLSPSAWIAKQEKEMNDDERSPVIVNQTSL